MHVVKRHRHCSIVVIDAIVVVVVVVVAVRSVVVLVVVVVVGFGVTLRVAFDGVVTLLGV